MFRHSPFLRGLAIALCLAQPVHAAALQGAAYKAAEAAYAAIARGDLAEAERQARSAMDSQPDSADAVRLLMDVLSRRGQPDQALGVANAAIVRGVSDPDLRAARGYLFSAAGHHDQAVEDFTAALQASGLPADRQRALRLSLADAASAAGKPAAALEALAPLAGESAYDVQARRGFAAFSLNRFDEAAKAFAVAAVQAKSPEEWTTGVKGRAQAEASLAQSDQSYKSSVIALVEKMSGELPSCDLDLAYILLRVGADDRALAMFEGRCREKMTAASHLDAAYAARRLGRNAQADDHFKAALDANRNHASPSFDAATEFGVRRSVDALEREFGLSAGAFYRAGRTAAGGGNVGQGIVEGYWQPEGIGNRDGKILQFYGRVGLNALTPASTLQTDSLQGAAGVRYKPFSELNLVVAGERLFPIGDAAVSDWLLRAGYSIGFNTDMSPTETSYLTGNIYGEADYFVDQDRFIGTLEGRYGLDTRVGASPRLLASVYASGAYNYDSAEFSKSAAALGIGAGLRYWFRESIYRAPASFIQFDVMYRWKLGPTDRAAGLVLQSSLAF